MPFIAVAQLPASVTGVPLAPLGPGKPLIGAMTVRVGPAGLPAAHLKSLVSPHGNPINPKQPGYNPLCKAATISLAAPKILVEGKPLAFVGSLCSCGQHKVSLGVPTVIVGL